MAGNNWLRRIRGGYFGAGERTTEEQALVYHQDNWDIVDKDNFDPTSHYPDYASRRNNIRLVEVKWSQSKKELNSFAPFSSLPLELRRRVWQLAMPPPRILFLVVKRMTIPRNDSRPRSEHFWFLANEIDRGHPELSMTLNGVCRESRTFFHETYRPLSIPSERHFSVTPSDNAHEEYRFHVKCAGLIDARRDTVLIRPYDLPTWTTTDTAPYFLLCLTMGLDLTRLHNIAIDLPPHQLVPDRTVQFVLQYLEARCPRLKNLSWVLGGNRSRTFSHQGTHYLKDIDHESADAYLHTALTLPNAGLFQLRQYKQLFRDCEHMNQAFGRVQAQTIDQSPWKPNMRYWNGVHVGASLVCSFNPHTDLSRKVFTLLAPKQRVKNNIFFTMRPVFSPKSFFYVAPVHEIEIPCTVDGELVDEHYIGIKELFEGYPRERSNSELSKFDHLLRVCHRVLREASYHY